MRAVVLPVPASWRQVEPPASKYVVGDDLVLDVSAIRALPEDPPEWMRVEVARRTGVTLERSTVVTTTTGWTMLLAEVSHGDRKLLVAMFQFLELAAVATLAGEAAAFDKHADEVKLVLVQATVHWGDPPLTLASLLAGASPVKH
jgi:hypothetical protein